MQCCVCNEAYQILNRGINQFFLVLKFVKLQNTEKINQRWIHCSDSLGKDVVEWPTSSFLAHDLSQIHDFIEILYNGFEFYVEVFKFWVSFKLVSK